MEWRKHISFTDDLSHVRETCTWTVIIVPVVTSRKKAIWKHALANEDGATVPVYYLHKCAITPFQLLHVTLFLSWCFFFEGKSLQMLIMMMVTVMFPIVTRKITTKTTTKIMMMIKWDWIRQLFLGATPSRHTEDIVLCTAVNFLGLNQQKVNSTIGKNRG